MEMEYIRIWRENCMMTLGEYFLRPIIKEDLKLILEWRNSERVHSMMLTDYQITSEEHYKWFKKITQNEIPLHFVFCYKKKPIGYMGYDIDWKNKICYPSLYIGCINGIKANAGIILGKMAINYAFESLKMHKICAYVLENNERIQKLNNFIGYKDEGYLEQHFFKSGKYTGVIIQSIINQKI